MQENSTRLIRLTNDYTFIENDDDVIAYFSLSNDKIAIPDSDKATWRKIKQVFPHHKHRSDYPAVKIGRLGVNKKYQGTHIGTDILDFVKTMFLTNNRTGCAFITVDALKCAIPFYLNNGFKYLDKTKAESDDLTCPLYYNLSQLLP